MGRSDDHVLKGRGGVGRTGGVPPLQGGRGKMKTRGGAAVFWQPGDKRLL